MVNDLNILLVDFKIDLVKKYDLKMKSSIQFNTKGFKNKGIPFFILLDLCTNFIT